MPITLTIRKAHNGSIVPDGPDDAKIINKLKPGQTIRAEWVKERNNKFHRKWFALVNFAFKHWEPPEIDDPRFKGIDPGKDFNRFRKDLIILTGRFEVVHRIDGTFMLVAKSIRFGAMDDEEFAKLYSDTIDVVLQKILVNYTQEELERVVLDLLAFA